jgi:hypothetical protein
MLCRWTYLKNQYILFWLESYLNWVEPIEDELYVYWLEPYLNWIEVLPDWKHTCDIIQNFYMY